VNCAYYGRETLKLSFDGLYFLRN